GLAAKSATTEQILSGVSREIEQFTGTTLTAAGPSALSDDIALVCLRRE
ncbi:MAG: hypothetical protein JNJ69_12970, partial [Leptospiraceae bacterium]|nr:hypothetical protein [Leptospiraceae bacterium]